MTRTIHRVAAFADEVHAGNPAAVCLLDEAPWPDDMQAIAARVGLSETAFVRREGDTFAIRWFTPVCEVPLCGHATLASAFVLGAPRVTFTTREAGDLTVERDGERFTMDFPAHALAPATIEDDLIAALGARSREVLDGFKKVARFDEEADLRALAPDFVRLAAIAPRGLAVTAPGDHVDFVSRYFAPHAGVDEDPVTGSAHTVLAPYWARELGRDTIVGAQIPPTPPPEGRLAWTEAVAAAARPGGLVHCQVRAERVLLGGTARRTGVAEL